MIYLYGASGHAKVVIEILEQQNGIISGLIDSDPDKKSLLDYPVFQQMPQVSDGKIRSIICIGNNLIRRKLANEIEANFVTAIHRSANISPRCLIGQGSVIMSSVSVNCDAIIGNHVILNTNCSVDHDCIVQDYVHISPNAALAGNVSIGEGTHVGIGASIIQGIKIGKWATIGAGAVIIEDVPDYAVVVGNPGKIIKYNQPN
ncbi:MAG TPA: acetyltransferase [Mucilaginibacter sp.]|jgi:sugar O-acyltransferase (sialic acid O-acetyltransferase NeuD family)|nr:acetyltransferase [Mucilaginibacter sp.]